LNSTSIKEAVATGYPREKMYGVWWSARNPTSPPPAMAPRATTRWCSSRPQARARFTKDIIKYVYDKGQGTGKKEDIGEVLYNRGMVSVMMTVEA